MCACVCMYVCVCVYACMCVCVCVCARAVLDIRLRFSTSLDHLAWAIALPPCVGLRKPPDFISNAVLRAHQLGPSRLQAHRAAALAYWLERKRVLDPIWSVVRLALPNHVQAVLGPKKNLLLLKEMLTAAQFTDLSIVDDLATGFRLIGEIPRSGISASPVSRQPASESRQSLQDASRWRNQQMLSRVSETFVPIWDIRHSMCEKVSTEVSSGQASYVDLESLVDSCVLTPRFPAVQGDCCIA